MATEAGRSGGGMGGASSDFFWPAMVIDVPQDGQDTIVPEAASGTLKR